MNRSKFLPATKPLLYYRLEVASARNLGIFRLLLITWLFVACTTLPDPGMKTISHSVPASAAWHP